MKKIVTISFLLLFAFTFAQPATQWVKAFGGTNIDRGYCVIPGPNNTYIATGLSISTDVDVTCNHGSYDAWVANIDATGNVIWTSCLGGTNGEGGNFISPAKGGGYYVMCNTLTKDSTGALQIVTNHGNYDWWIVKIGATGAFQWGTCVGSTDADGVFGIVGTSDGGAVATGSAGNKNGDFATGGDGWAVKVSSTGSQVWKSTFGKPSSTDILRAPIETKDGGLMISGQTASGNPSKGATDLWALKLDANGGVQWQGFYGGSGDDGGSGVIQLADESYVFCGATASNDGDVVGHASMGTGGAAYDAWVIKVDKTGTLLWQKTYGGSNYEEFTSVAETPDHGLVLTGTTKSTDIPNLTAVGATDFIVVKLDVSGNLKWQKLIGGTSFDEGTSIAVGTDGGIAAFGFTKSTDGDLANAFIGNYDMMMVKIAPENTNGLTELAQTASVNLYPNPVNGTSVLMINNPSSSTCNYVAEISDVLGHVVKKINMNDCRAVINKDEIGTGMYFYQISVGDDRAIAPLKGKFIVE